MQKTLLDLDPHDCRWPLDLSEWDEQLFCCDPVVPGKSYCAFHRALSLETKKRRPVVYVEAELPIAAE